MTATITGNPDTTTPYLINDTGEIIGLKVAQDLTQSAVLYRFGQAPVSQYPVSDSGAQLYFAAINELGAVAGTIEGGLGATDTATVWQNGTTTSLPNWTGDTLGNALGINDFGIVVGVSVLRTGAANFGDEHALVWQNGQASLLAPLAGDVGAYAEAINDAGLIVGESYGLAAAGSSDPYLQHAVTWTNGVASPLAAVASATGSSAYFINSAGDIAGVADFADGTSHAVLWHNGAATDLGSLPGYAWSQPTAINDLGQVVGTVSTVANYDGTSGSQHAVLWENGKVIDLNSLPGAGSSPITYVSSINDAGEIIAGTADGLTIFIDLYGPFASTVSTAASVVQGVQQGVALGPVAFADSAADVAANLDGLQGLAAAGQLKTITLLDSGIPTLSLTAAQLSGDGAALSEISGSYALLVAAGSSSATLTGPSGHATTVQFGGTVGQYTLTVQQDGSLMVSSGSVTDHLTNVTALQFADHSEIVAQTPRTTGVTTGNVTELYGAVFGREPDAAGLAYYQSVLAANPTLPLSTFAQWFLAAPEYTSNSAHAYAATAAGDAQFITDIYNNLLHRGPQSGDVAWYQANVLAPIIGDATPGTAAYAAAQTLAHAQLLVDFSASAEFLNDVQVTAQHPADSQHWLVLT